MHADMAGVSVLRIPAQPGLDPIMVVMRDDAPGKGMLIVQCFDVAWTCYFGAMGNRSLLEFIASVGRDYLGIALWRGPGASKAKMAYAERVANAVILAARERITELAPAPDAAEVRRG